MITETFDVGTGVPGLGDWSVTLKAGTVQRILGPFVPATLSLQKAGPTENLRHSLLVVTDGRVTAPDRAGVLARALFAGELLRFSFPNGRNGEWTIGGQSFLNWLGDSDDKGPGINTGTDYTAASPYTGTIANYLLGLTVAGACNGIGLDATAASVDTGNFTGLELRTREIARQRVFKLCQATTPLTEYWADPKTLTLYFQGAGDTTNAYYRWDPLTLFSPDVPASREASLTSYEVGEEAGGKFTVEIDYGPVATGLRGENTAGSSTFTTGSSDPFRNDITGTGSGSRAKFLGASDDLYSQMRDASAAEVLAQRYTRADTVGVTVPHPVNVRRDLKPGDHAYVYDPLLGIMDTANTVVHGGMSIAPRKVRCSSMRWPLQADMGVYLITVETEYGGVNGVVDLSQDFVPERGGTAIAFATASPTTLTKLVRGSQYRTRWDDR